jgi:hypothetical protein
LSPALQYLLPHASVQIPVILFALFGFFLGVAVLIAAFFRAPGSVIGNVFWYVVLISLPSLLGSSIVSSF